MWKKKVLKQSQETSAKFTLIEMLVVIAIIGILASMLMPALQSAQAAAYKTLCSSNLKNIGIVVSTYVNEYNGEGPWLHYGSNNSKTWGNLLAGDTTNYSRSEGFNELVTCPSLKKATKNGKLLIESNWGYNSYGMTVGYTPNYYKFATGKVRATIPGWHKYNYFYVKDTNIPRTKRIYISDSRRGIAHHEGMYRLGNQSKTDGGMGMLNLLHSGTGNGLALDFSVQNLTLDDALDANFRDIGFNEDRITIQ